MNEGGVMNELVLSGWATVSPFGLGTAPFSAGVLGGDSGISTLDLEVWPGPYDRAGIVPDFDVVKMLGAKGTRTMDRATAIAVTTVGMLLDQCGPDLTAAPEDVGLVLGTSCGSVRSTLLFTRDALTGERPYHVDPARFPNTVMNFAAGQSAIRFGLKGPNTTVAGGGLTGLLALSYAARLYRAGHCQAVLCGAVEEYSEQRGWLEWHSRPDHRALVPLGEGCVMFLLEPRGSATGADRPVLGVLRGCRFVAFTRSDDARPALARCIGAALHDAGCSPADVRIVAPSDADGRLGVYESAAIRDVLGSPAAYVTHSKPLLGDTSAASAGFQLAAALVVAADQPDTTNHLALATSIDADGRAGCALVELAGGRPAATQRG